MKITSINEKFLRLATRILGTSLGLFLLVAVIFFAVRTAQTSQQFEKKYRSDLISKGNLLVTNNCIAMRQLAQDNQIGSIREMVEATTRDISGEIVYGLFMDDKRRPWAVAQAFAGVLGGTHTAEMNDSTSLWAQMISDVDHKRITIDNTDYIEFAAPVLSNGERLGTIRYCLSTARLQTAITTSKREFYISIAGFISLVIVALFVIFIMQRKAVKQQSDSITRPLIELTDAVNGISQGDSSIPINIIADDEVGILAREFETMRQTIKSYTDGLEHMVEQRTQQLYAAQKEKLIQADKLATLGTLVAGVAHEINNPNNAILLSTGLLRDIWHDITPVLDRFVQEHGEFAVGGLNYQDLLTDVPITFDRVLNNAQRIKSYVGDLKNYARKDSDEPLQMVDINAAVRSSLQIINDQIRKCTDKFTVTTGENIPGFKGISRHFEQIVVNLVQNACHSLPSRDKGVSVTTSYDPATNMIIMDVQDEGQGMTPEVIKKICDPFFTTRGGKGGTGLGLTVILKIIQGYQGSLDFQSEPGKGTLARVMIPAYREGVMA